MYIPLKLHPLLDLVLLLPQGLEVFDTEYEMRVI